MSDAKKHVLNALNDISDDIDDEIEVVNNLYHRLRLDEGRKAVADGNSFSTDDVRKYFAQKRQGVYAKRRYP